MFILIIGILFGAYAGITRAQAEDGAGDSGFIKSIEQKLLAIWQRLREGAIKLFASVGKVIEERKPIIKQELEKEKEEARQDLIKIKDFILKKIWQHLK